MPANLDNFKTAFSNTYQEVFLKVAVAMKIANTRLLSELYYGKAIERVYIDFSGVYPQAITQYTDLTQQSTPDTSETLTVDQNFGILVPISDKEMIQAGPLNPGEFIGSKISQLISLKVDADVLYQTTLATYDFDNGDLTTSASTGTPITISSTTVPQMAMRLPAKLRAKNNQIINSASSMAFVADAYTIGDLFQYLLGKNADFVNNLFQNGYTNEQWAGAKIYQSENITGEVVLTGTGTFSNGETIVINGITFTAVSSIGTTAGNFLIGANLAASLTNLAGLINAPTTTSSTQVALSAANAAVVGGWTATATSTTVTVVMKGSGRPVLSETAANASFTTSMVHCYYGKEGAIDAVVQKDVSVDMRKEPKQPTTNIMATVLYGVKTYNDGKAKFLDVLINAA
jgi:hypothetical protein